MGARFWRLRPEKKDTVVCLLGAWFWQLRPEKKDTVVCLMGCAVVLFFVVAGNFDYGRKKKIQLSVWRVRDHILVQIRIYYLEYNTVVVVR